MNKPAVAYLLLRITLGTNFLLHGLTRLLADHALFAAYLAKQMHATPIPPALIHAIAATLPYTEATIGAFMLLGLFTPIALTAAGLSLLMLQAGSCLAQDWSTAGTQLLYVLLVFILLTFADRNIYSLDQLLHRRV
jgi:thiosulfate dehydrogenase [quinone] large subunit